MKNRVFLIITASSLLHLNIFGQNGFDILEKFKNKKIENITEFSQTPFVDGTENKNIRIAFGSSFQIKNSREVIFKLTRVRQKSSSDMGELEIDTDSPYPNNQLEKGMVDFYMLSINKPIFIIFNENGERVSIKAPNNNFGKSHLTILHPITEFSGIFLTHSPLQNKTWADTVLVDGETYINKYTVQGENNILLEGGLFKKKELIVDKIDTNMEIPANGANIEAKTKANEMNYKAVIQYDKNTLLITQLNGELNKVETLSFFGQTHEKQTHDYFRIKNLIK